MSIAKKHAQKYMPNGELSLEQVIQAAIDEATHMMHRAAEVDARAISILQERIRQLEQERVPLGILDSMINLVEGLPVHGWCNTSGLRMKDHKVWAEFYCATKKVLAAAPSQEKVR